MNDVASNLQRPGWKSILLTFSAMLVASAVLAIASVRYDGLRNAAFFAPGLLSLPVLVVAFSASRIGSRSAVTQVMFVVASSLAAWVVFLILYYFWVLGGLVAAMRS